MKLAHCPYEYIPVILGSNMNSLGTIRAFRSLGLGGIIVAEEDGMACHSKYTVKTFIQDDLVEGLEKAGAYLASIGKKGYLLATSDDYALRVAQLGSLPNFHIVNNNAEIIQACLDKTGLYPLFDKIGVDYPRSRRVEEGKDLLDIHDLKFPLLVKPVVSIHFSDRFDKATILHKETEVKNYVNRLEKAGLDRRALVAQEYIPGSEQNLIYYFAYIKKGETIREVASRKIRQYPPNAGTTTAGLYEDIPGVYPVGQKIDRALAFDGLHGMEFKYDPRDGKYYFLDSNPRTYLDISALETTGVNVLQAAYLDFMGESIDFIPKKIQREVLWIKDHDDMIRALYSNKKRHPDYALSYRQYKKTLQGNVVYAVKDADDPEPRKYINREKVNYIVKKLFRRG